MFLGYSTYPITLIVGSPGLGAVKMAKLDRVHVAGCLTSEAQAELAGIAPFARRAFRTIHDEQFFLSLLLPRHPGSLAPERRKTRGCWIKHLRILRGDNVLCSFTGEPALCISTYFAILKANGTARTIFSGGRLSQMFYRPPPVNLPSLPLVLTLLGDLLRGFKFYLLVGDLRHYFHQIQMGASFPKFFTMECCAQMFAYVVLPMGWSFSPSIAQSYAWAALLGLASYENGLKKSADEFLAQAPEHPPGFMLLHNEEGRAVGLILIWYDNYICWCLDQKIVVAMSQTWSEMTKRWGIVWGEKKLWHPSHLSSSSADKNPEVGVSLGIQFARAAKRTRDEPEHQLTWRLRPKTALAAEALVGTTTWSCRSIAGVIGSAIWQCYILCEGFSSISETLDLSSRVGGHAKQHGWNSEIGLTPAEKLVVAQTLEKLRCNPWSHSPGPRDWTRVRIVASDATLERGAWVYYSACDCRAQWRNWNWSEQPLAGTSPFVLPCESNESIFLLELRAAIKAIKELSEENGVLVIVTDNTAAAEVLRSRYSSTRKGRVLVKDLHDFLQAHNVFLIVAGIAGLDNDADAPTRGDIETPSWCARRLRVTWQTGIRALYGSERLRLNPMACGLSHRYDEVEEVTSMEHEDADCEGQTAAIERLMKNTML